MAINMTIGEVETDIKLYEYEELSESSKKVAYKCFLDAFQKKQEELSQKEVEVLLREKYDAYFFEDGTVFTGVLYFEDGKLITGI